MPAESPFDFVPTEDKSVLSFWVLVANHEITEDNMPLDGVTTLGEFKLNTAGRPHKSYDDYVFVDTSPAATPGFLRFYFAKSATSRILKGQSYESPDVLPPSQFVAQAVIETSTKVVPYGTAVETGSDVLSSVVTPLNAMVSRYNKDAVLSFDGTPLYSWVLDPDTGKGYQVVEQAVPAGTVGSSEVAVDAYFSDVRPVSAVWSIMTTKKTTTLTNTPRVWQKTERSPVLWPDILVNKVFYYALAKSTTYFIEQLVYTVQEAYTGDVKVTYSEWWQKSAPAPLTPVEMIPTGIEIPRMWSPSISIAPCLHDEFTVKDFVIVGHASYPGWAYATPNEIAFTVPATNVKTWPDEVVKLDVDPWKGGFRCLKRVIEKPQSAISGILMNIGGYNDNGLVMSNYD